MDIPSNIYSDETGQSLVEFILVNSAISLGLLSIWAAIQLFITGLVGKLVQIVSLPLP
jgi:hypothetical protein